MLICRFTDLQIYKFAVLQIYYAAKLRHMFPSIDRGFSVRTVWRSCKNHVIENINEEELDDIVAEALEEVEYRISVVSVNCITIEYRFTVTN